MTAAPVALSTDLEAGLKRLKLATVRRIAPDILQTAKTQRWKPEEVLRTLVEAEIAARDEANRRGRHRQAGFPVVKTFDGFDVAASSVPQATVGYLAGLEWIRAPENLCLVGPAGTGKSHLLIAAGHAAVEAGHRVRHLPAAELVETLYRGIADNSVGRGIDQLLRNDVVLVDEVGFAPLDATGTQLLFRFVAAAYERRPGHRLTLGVQRLGPVPARAHHRHLTTRPTAAPRRRDRHRRRLLPDAHPRRWPHSLNPPRPLGNFTWPPVGNFTWPLTIASTGAGPARVMASSRTAPCAPRPAGSSRGPGGGG